MGLLWEVTSAMARGTWAVSRAAATATANAIQAMPSASARRGILGPHDAPPSAQAGIQGIYDYRGVATAADVVPAPADFPLGRHVDPRRWRPRGAVGISERAMNEHTIVLGPTRSGKTRSVIVPWIYAALRAGWSVVTIDVKGHGDLLSAIKDYARAHGSLGAKVYGWDYTGNTPSVSWDWVADLATDGQRNAAVEAICGRPSPADPNKFFHQSAVKYLRGLLELAGTMAQAPDLEQILGIIADQPTLESLVDARAGHPGAQRLRELCGMSTSDYVKHTMELRTHLETLCTSGFVASTRRGGFTFDGFLGADGPSLAICTAPVSDGQLAEAACGLYMGQLVQRVLDGYGMARRPLLLAIDEAPRLQGRIDLGSALSLVAAAGTSVLLAAQDVEQFDPGKRSEILANCGTAVCLPRVSRQTTDWFSGRLGEMGFSSRTHSSAMGGAGGSHSWTDGYETRPVLGHREISSPHPALGQWPAFVHAPSLSSRPIVVDLTQEGI